MDRFYARVCWNTNGWRRPSGDAALLEHDTYAAKDRFGHEEWLFNFMWTFDGYHYAFLQGVNSASRNKGGTVIEVLLWSINDKRQRVYVGEIKQCEVLTETQSLDAFEKHKRAGWVDLMKKDLVAIQGNVTKLSPDSLFNIRFRIEDAVLFDDPLPIAKATDRISRLTRYKLVAATPAEVATEWRIRTRMGSNTAPQPSAYVRGSSQGGVVDPYHPRLQRSLMILLQAKYGKQNVSAESGWVDLTVSVGKKVFFVEIKTDNVAKRAVREALGQILEYAFFNSRSKKPEHLFIVAPGVPDADVQAYLSFLRSSFGLPITYCQFTPGDPLPSALGSI